jgi:hypothetical protein
MTFVEGVVARRQRRGRIVLQTKDVKSEVRF